MIEKKIASARGNVILLDFRRLGCLELFEILDKREQAMTGKYLFRLIIYLYSRR